MTTAFPDDSVAIDIAWSWSRLPEAAFFHCSLAESFHRHSAKIALRRTEKISDSLLMEREHTLRQRSYWVLIFSSLSRLAVMDSSTELVPLIHSPPSRRRV